VGYASSLRVLEGGPRSWVKTGRESLVNLGVCLATNNDPILILESEVHSMSDIASCF
jgi:hypothetical protein